MPTNSRDSPTANSNVNVKNKKQKTKRKQNIFSSFLSGFPNIQRYSSQMGEIAHMTRRVRTAHADWRKRFFSTETCGQYSISYSNNKSQGKKKKKSI